MNKRILFPILILAAVSTVACTKPESPVLPSPLPPEEIMPGIDPEDEIGWYNAPYIRYEAEADAAGGTCLFLPASDNKKDVQNEASHHIAAQLVNEGDYIEWTCKEAAEGMVIRFSIPDAPMGGGIKGHISLAVDGKVVCESIELDSYHAWQYKDVGMGPFNWHYDNTPGEGRDVRMKYDEKRVLLDKKIPEGSKFRLIKLDGGSVPYTIDFVELEPVPDPLTYLDVMDGTTICYHPETDGNLRNFVYDHMGFTIFIPPGHYDVEHLLEVTSNTKLVGAGSWYTELHFIADPDNQTSINARGFLPKDNAKNVGLKHLYMDTMLERRYLDIHGSGGSNGAPPGKGVWGNIGDNFIMEDVWIEHFECGTWIMSLGENARITKCRIRNNYADGLHISQGNGLEVSCCNCRNNGDDQLIPEASESLEVTSSEIRHCTVELGWRAGGLGVLGAMNLDMHNILVRDHYEDGFRLLTEFYGYTYRGENRFSNIILEKCGSRGDTSRPDEYGSFTGGSASALLFSCGGLGYDSHDIENVTFENIDIISPYSDGISITGPQEVFSRWKNISISNWGAAGNQDETYYAVRFSDNAGGEILYENLVMTGNEDTKLGAIPSTMKFEEIK